MVMYVCVCVCVPTVSGAAFEGLNSNVDSVVPSCTLPLVSWFSFSETFECARIVGLIFFSFAFFFFALCFRSPSRALQEEKELKVNSINAVVYLRQRSV